MNTDLGGKELFEAVVKNFKGTITKGKEILPQVVFIDSVVDISPFICMQSIVCEAVYPQLSRDHDHFPVRTFYLDRTRSDLDRDAGIFRELAKSYQ